MGNKLIESDCFGFDIRRCDITPGTHPSFTDENSNKSIKVDVFKDRVYVKSGLDLFAGFRELGQQMIMFSRTPCNYGGYRTWFICPDCNRRTTSLYWRVTDGIPDLRTEKLACRKCQGLVYASEGRDRGRGNLNRAERLYEKIGGKYGNKPKGMHWNTYNRLRLLAEQYSNLITI